jgi:hypothetical protein
MTGEKHVDCDEGEVCEAHPELPWPHDDCAGPGMPCPNCRDKFFPPDNEIRVRQSYVGKGLKAKCCFLTCSTIASWELYPQGSTYSETYTHSCDKHLADMLDVDSINEVRALPL